MRQFLWSSGDELVPPGFVAVDPFRSDLATVALEAGFGTADLRSGAELESLLRTRQLHLLIRDASYPVGQPGRWTRSDDVPADEDIVALKDLAPPQTLDPNEVPPPEPPRPVWIRIELVDLDGRPLPDHPFRLQLADGSVREGVFDDTGEIRFDDVTPGPCTLLLPTEDELEWAPTG